MSEPGEISKYELLLMAVIGMIMVQTGCSEMQARERIAILMVATEDALNVRAKK
jgi:hypothetical protein